MPDDIDMKLLLDLNTRTLVNGATVDTGLIAGALGLSGSQLRDCLNRLQQQGLIALEAVDLVGLTPLGHEHLTRAVTHPEDDAGRHDGPVVRAPAADLAESDGETFYTSQNGDTWRLVTDTGGRQFVRHTANRSSGGAAELTDLQSFLGREPQSPQNQALERVLR